jgi:flagellin
MEMDIEIPELNRGTLGLMNMSYLLINEAESAINVCDDALAEVSEVRARLGAYQNRLEYNVTSLDATTANMQESLSRIADTDMAKEMTFYTQQNVINQAGLSILAQANQRPQQILQLIG